MSSIDRPHSVRGAVARLRRTLAVGLWALALTTCSDEPTAPGRPGLGALLVTPAFDAHARLVPLTLDNVRVIVIRPASDTLADVRRAFSPANNQLQLNIPVILAGASENLDVTLQLFAGATLLFEGTSTVTVAAGPTPSPGAVPVTYQGPGSQLASITLAPRDTSVTLGASFPLRATAIDSQQAPVAQFYVSWSSTGGTIDGAGIVTAPGARDTFMVRAMTPTGVGDSTLVYVIAPPSTLLKVGGDNQAGVVGSRLAQPLAVQVNGADGLPVPGVQVGFAVAAGGGAVDSAIATTDAQGVARSGAVLGLSVGAQSFTATVTGLPAATFSATATGVNPAPRNLAAGNAHSCELRGTQALCWGDNSQGQLGDGTSAASRLVATPVAGGHAFSSIVAGDAHSCALTAQGQAFCWGENSSGELGDGSNTLSRVPVAVSGGQTFVQLTAGGSFTCGLTAAGQAFCWGLNSAGNLGDGSTSNRNVPTLVAGGQVFSSIAIGAGLHACGLTPSGQAFCWGDNGDGQLGDGSTTGRNLPGPVGGGHTFTAIALGSNFTCAIDPAGQGFCWGFNFGQTITTPTAVPGGPFASLDLGVNHVCALTPQGQAFCGGDNSDGQLGDGSGQDQPTPVAVQGGFTYTEIAGGGAHTCGRTSAGTRCWGANASGELGDGSNTPRPAPTLSRGPATTVAINAGNNQTATTGTPVSVPPSVVVRDAQNNPLPGVEVTFAVTAGGGSITGPVALTDNQGIAAVGSWTLGATAGVNQMTATVGALGVAGNPVTFTATGGAPSVLTWNGSVSTDWSTAANWTPALVPTPAQDVTIPAAPANQPVLTTTGNTGSLTVQSGASLTLNGTFTLNVAGNLDASGAITTTGGAPTLVLSGAGRALQGTVNATTAVTGSYTLNGNVVFGTGNLSVSGGTASLTVGGHSLQAVTLTLGSGGSFVMTDPSDIVTIAGNFVAGGGDHSGKLTNGQLIVGGNFTQSSAGSPLSFAASGTHLTTLIGPSATVSFQTPGAAASRFSFFTTTSGAQVTLASRVVATNTVVLGGRVVLAGHTFESQGLFSVAGPSALVQMTNPLDSLIAASNVLFDGDSSLGSMSAGVLVVGGAFTQLASASPDAFHPSGTHKTVLSSTLASVNFTTPGEVPGSSHFQELEWRGGGLNLLSDVYAHGTLTVSAAGASTITSTDKLLKAGGLVSNVPLEFAGGRLELFQPTGGPLALQDLTFSGSATTGTQLTITHNGAGGPFTLANPVFGTVPTTGLYLQADDPDGATNGALTLNVVNPTPNTPGGFVLAQGGAVVNWPATAPAATWTGAVNSNWSTAGNWSTGSVPTATTDVLIPAGLGTYPVLSTGVFARDLTVATGASLTQGNQSITVSGNLDLSGTVTGASVVIMNGTGVTARGTVPGVLSVQGPGPVTVTGPLTAVSQLNVTGGDFIVAGHTVTTGSFNTTGTGTITMTNPLDTLHVTTGSATFRGGNSTGKFTAGAVRLSGGGFDSQLGTFAFASTGTALIFDGSANQSVANNVGGNSFADIIVNKSGGNFIWAGGAPITGVLQVLSPTAVTGAQTIQARRVITAAGSSLAMSGLTIDSDSLTVGGSYAVTTTTFNGGAFIPALAYVGLSLNSDSIITAAGSFSTTQFLSVNGFTDFVLGGHTVTVGADFALGGLASLLTMTNPLDTLIVLGNANFSGGNLTGRLTAGALRLTGNFLMGSASGFVSSGTRLVFEQSATQTFGLANTGAVFQDVELAKAGGAVNLGGTTLTVSGQLSTAAGSTNIITGTGGSLVATSVNVDGLTLDNVPLTIGNGSLTRFDNVTFQNHAATATQLTVTNNGAGGPATFTNLSFGTVPSTGLYLQANDPDASANGSLTLNLANPTPGTPGGFVATTGGATVNWPASAPAKTWTGAVDNNWFDPGNWNPAGAPTSADDVTIPAGPANQPHLNGLGQVRAFTLQGGASLLLGNSGTLQVNGNYAADGTVTDTSGFTRQVVLLGATPATVRGNATHLSVGGPRTVTGPIVTLGGLDIAGGTLTLAGNPVSVGGSFAVQLTNSGLIMTNPSDILTVTGNVTFAGPDQTGRLTDGVIQVQGNFTQSGSLSSQAFVSTGTQVVLFGGGNHTISFAQPGPTQSRFANLLILKASGTITLQSDVTATGSLMQLASPITIDGAFGTTRTLSVAGVEVNGFTLDNVLLQVGNGPLTKLDNVNFVNIPLTATALTLQADGDTGPFTINNLNFNYTPTAGGFYLVADDLDGPAPTPLTLNLVNPTPAAPGPFTNAVNGAVINWPAGSPALTWTGAVDSDWDNPANWSTGQVPTSTDDVIIPATANNPQAGTIFTRNLTIQSGASVSAGDHTFHIGGSLDAQGLLGGPGACCTVEMTGSGVTARGNIEDFSLSIMPGASVTLNGNLALVNSSNLAVDGELIIGGHSLIAGQASLLIQGGTGLLTMTHPADVVQVNFVDFAGGDETGRLTAGILATESLAQTGPVATSFVASGSHRVVLGGPGASAISFDNPASARFQDLDLTTVTGTVFLNSDVTVLGTLSATPGGTNGPVVSGGGQFRAVTAGTTAIDAQPGFDALVMDGVNLVISGGATPTFYDVIFQGQNPLATQLTVNNVGLGAPFVFDRLTFNTTPQPGGLYLSVTDLDGPAPTALQVQLVNATPASPGNFTQAANGASITWNGGQPAVSWTGAVSSDWQVAGNWSTGTVPTFGTDVVIPSGTPNAPVLTTNAAINDLTIQPGATLGLAGFTLVTTGNVDNGGLVTATPGVGGFSLAGAGKLLRGNFDEVTFGIGGTYSLNGRLLVGGATGGNLAISAGGLTLNGHTAEVTGAFATSGVGVVIMQDSQDSLIVRGDALFAGGNTTGALTAGVFRLGGNLAAVGGDPAAFSPQLTHKTFMEAGQPNTPTEVQFADPAASHFANVEFANPFGVSLASRAMATTSGPVTAVVSDGEFSTAGNTFEVGGLFGTTNNGYLRMPLPGDSLIATDATFAGASTDGMLTEGTLVVTNTLVQNAISSITSFAPSGNHKTVVGSGFLGTHLIDIGSPGPGNAGSHFNHLDLSPASTGVTLGVNTPVSGLLIAHDIGNGTPRLASSGSTLQVAGGLDVTALTVDNTPLVVQAGAGAPLQFDGATFQNMDPTVVQFDLSHPGAAAAFTFNNLTFATTPSSGQYLSLTDLDGAAPDAFTLNLVNPTPATDGGFSSVSNGAVLNWPATAPGITWTGAASSDWSNPANWSPTVVPTSTSDVVIPSALGTYPVLTAPAFTRNLVVQTGASIDLNGFTLTSSGDVDAGTTISGAGTFAVDGVAKTLRGTVPNLRVTGTTTLSGTTAVTGSLTIDGVNAVLGMGGQAATVAGDLVVQNSGVLVMTSSTDQLTVNGDATFAGGDETGLLIDGVLQVAGDFTQVSATVPTSFVAGGTHRTELIGPGLQVLTFADSTVSGFRDLAIQGTDTTRVHNSMIRVTGNVTVQPGAKLAATNPSFTGNGLAVNGNFSAASTAHLGLGRLYLRGSLSITGPYFITSTIFNGTGQTIPVGPQYRYLYVQGSATSQDGVAVDSALVIQGAGALTLGGRMDVARGIFVENGVLDLAGNTLTSGTLFSTSGGGVLRMQNALDSLIVVGNVFFDGGSTAGQLTAGTIRYGGNFTQTATTSGASFAPSGSHTVVPVNVAGVTVSFATPGTSFFQDLDLGLSDANFQLLTPVTVNGTFAASANGTVVGDGTDALTVNGAPNVTSLLLDNVPLILNGTGAMVFDNVTFQNFDPTLTQLTVNHPGPGAPFQFNNLVFATTPTTGLFLSATDTNVGDSQDLFIEMVNPTPDGAVAGPFVQTGGTASVLWP